MEQYPIPPGEVEVSVLVPVLNEERYIRDAVATMLAQRTDGDLELIFVDGRSDDSTRAILEQMASLDPRIRIFDNPARRTPNGLNVALRRARGRYIARMDAHVHYPPDYLALGVERLAAGDVEWVSGPQIPQGQGNWSRRVATALQSRLGTGGALYRRMPAGEIEVDSGFTGVWRRSTVDRLGGWDEGWPVNQDTELAARVRAEGGRIVCLPEMAARYIPRDSLRALARQYARYGYYRAKTTKRHPQTLRRSNVLPPGVALAFVAAVVPTPLTRPARLAVSCYAVAVAGASVAAVKRAGWRDAATLPPVFAAMHLAWGFGFVAGSARFGIPLRTLLTRSAAVARDTDARPATGVVASGACTPA